MPDLPTGTVTFLFTDIEGSTRMWEEHPTEMTTALARHDRLLRAAIEVGAGHVFATGGDGFAAVFDRAHDALAVALQAQRDLVAVEWGELSVRVRIALHTGEAEERDGDYFGQALNKTARLMSVGHGGQVLVSQATVAIVGSEPPDGVTFKDLGEHRLKDLDRSEPIYQLQHSALVPDFGPLLTLGSQPNNLPTQLTSFVGRERELADLDDLFPSTRLVNLIGPGGSGKTRVALAVAGRHIDRYPDGVWFVDLAPITAPDHVPLAMARPFGVGGEPGRPTQRVLADYLSSRELLLVVDNCEHLVEKAAELVEGLLQAAPDLKVLATSREPLGVAGETIFEIHPLPVPNPENDLDIARFDGVQLFVERARSADPHFELSDTNAEVIAEICRRLDGIPLALELAAARIRAFGPEELIRLLDDRFGLLTSPLRTVQARHQTLRAAVEWSYDLLSEPERALFRRLSVFRGGFDLEAAQQVSGTDPLTPTDVLRLLPELGDKSLLVTDHPDGATRYRLLETLREYGQESLAAEEAGQVRASHGTYFCALAVRAAPHLRGPEQQSWIRRLAVDYDNLRRALRWAFTQDPEMGIRTATALADYWDAAGPRVEAHEWLKKAVELSKSTGPDLRIAAHLAASYLFISTHLSFSVQFATEALDEARAIGDETSEARALGELTLARGIQEDDHQAMSLGEKALQIFRRLDDPWGTAWCLLHLAQADHQDPDRSLQRYEESLALFRDLGDMRRAAMVLYNMADRSAQASRDLNLAEGWVDESLSIFQELGSTHDTAHALLELGRIRRRQGKPAEATDVLDTALELLRKVGDQRCTVRTLTALGLALTEIEDRERAGDALRESLELWQILDEKPTVRPTLAGLARLLAKSGQRAKAATLYAVVDKLGRELALPVSAQAAARRENRLEGLRGGMKPEEFDDAWKAGETMSLHEAIDLALAMPAP